MNIIQYYFDTFPLRPPLQPFESFTSYLTRVAEANGKRKYWQLKPFFGEYCNISSFADYPPRSFGMVPAIISCSESELFRTTFYHVGKKFGKLYNPRGLISFLSGVVASSLRYCPLCLTKALYYSLAWRFLSLKGCPKHVCRLLEHCSHCGSPVSIFPAPFRMGICPTCGGDLRKCISSGLTEFELLEANTSSKEIEFLLFPHQWETSEPSFHEKLGKEFMLLRSNKQLERKDVIAETGLSRHILEDIELGKTVSSRAKLRWYFKYTNYLGVPLDNIILNTIERREEDPRIKTMAGRYFLTSEDWVMEQVQEATRQLGISGQRITLKAVCAETGISKGGLYKYDRVKTFIGGILYHKKLHLIYKILLYEDQLLEKAQYAVQELSKAGKPITNLAVSSLLGISSRAFVFYPRVKKFLDQCVDYALQQQRRTEEREQALLEKVRTGVVDLEEHHLPVTYNAISKRISIRPSVWLPYAKVREFVEQYLDSRYLHDLKKREQREELLIPRIEEAISQLNEAGRPVSFNSVSRLIGVDSKTLMYYPRVNALIEQRRDLPRSGGSKSRRGEMEILSGVQQTISLLTERGSCINYSAIAREMGGTTPDSLRTYPKVRMLVDEYLRSHHLYELQHFAHREEQLLCRVKAAITELEEIGQPFTQRELLEKVGTGNSTLRRYPRVKSLLEQKVTHHTYYQRLRNQPEEEDFVQQVKGAINCLVDQGMNITPLRIASILKISSEVLKQYPQVVLILEQYGYKKRKSRSEREEELLKLIRVAIHTCKDSGQKITKQSLSKLVGLSCSALRRYPQVRALMTQAATDDRRQRRVCHFVALEEELTQQVVEAMQRLRDQNRPISQRAIEKLVHRSNIYSRYPKVRVLIESAMQAQHTTNASNLG